MVHVHGYCGKEKRHGPDPLVLAVDKSEFLTHAEL
jgi:hypothetical protein